MRLHELREYIERTEQEFGGNMQVFISEFANFQAGKGVDTVGKMVIGIAHASPKLPHLQPHIVLVVQNSVNGG